MTQSKPLAVVIEPRASLASTISDALEVRGYEVMVATTHVGAAKQVIQREKVDFLAAAVPAPGEDHTGAYLSAARDRNPALAVVVMLSDPHEATTGAPGNAVYLVKPFDRQALDRAIEAAIRKA